MGEPQPILICPHCSTAAPHQRLMKHSFEPLWHNSAAAAATNAPKHTVNYYAYECLNCHDLSLFHDIAGAVETLTMDYPEDRPLDLSVPARVRELYVEARAVQHRSPGLSCESGGRAIQAICDHKGLPVGPLQQRLEQLASRGAIPPALFGHMTILRLLKEQNGNGCESVPEVSVKEMGEVDKFFRMIIEYLYIAPKSLVGFRQIPSPRAVS